MPGKVLSRVGFTRFTRGAKYLMHFRAETGKASPGLEQGTKKAFELLNSMSTRVTEACWKRTGLKRFATLEDAEDADEESRLLNMMENLELDEEEKLYLEAEQDEVQEVPVSKKKPQEEKKKIQRQIRHSLQKRKNKLTIELVVDFENFSGYGPYGQKPHIGGPHISGSRL